MAFIRHFSKAGNNTVSVDLNNEEFTEELFVESDDPADTGVGCVAYLLANDYVYGKQYSVGNDDLTVPGSRRTYLYRINPPQLVANSVTMWQVTLQYAIVKPDMLPFGGQDGDAPARPWNRRPELSTSTVTREKGADDAVYHGGLRRDWEEGRRRSITNSADDPYSERIIYETQHRVVRVRRPFPSVYVNDQTMPLKWINRDLVVISDRKQSIRISPFTMRLLGWSTESVFEENTDFVMVTFEGEVNPEGWRFRRRDEGLNEKPYASPSVFGPKRPILSDGEGRLNGPQDLDGNGGLLEDDDPHGPYYAIWGVYNELDIRSMPFFQGMVI